MQVTVSDSTRTLKQIITDGANNSSFHGIRLKGMQLLTDRKTRMGRNSGLGKMRI